MKLRKVWQVRWTHLMMSRCVKARGGCGVALKKFFKIYSTNFGENDFISCVFKTNNISSDRHLKTALRPFLSLSKGTNLLISTASMILKVNILLIIKFQHIHKNTSNKYFSNVFNNNRAGHLSQQKFHQWKCSHIIRILAINARAIKYQA